MVGDDSLCGTVPPLCTSFDDGWGEPAKVIEMFRDDRLDNIRVQASVFMHGHVAEADHPLESAGQLGREKLSLLQQCERVPAFLWKA